MRGGQRRAAMMGVAGRGSRRPGSVVGFGGGAAGAGGGVCPGTAALRRGLGGGSPSPSQIPAQSHPSMAQPQQGQWQHPEGKPQGRSPAGPNAGRSDWGRGAAPARIGGGHRSAAPSGLLLHVPRCWGGPEPKPLATEGKEKRQGLCGVAGIRQAQAAAATAEERGCPGQSVPPSRQHSAAQLQGPGCPQAAGGGGRTGQGGALAAGWVALSSGGQVVWDGLEGIGQTLAAGRVTSRRRLASSASPPVRPPGLAGGVTRWLGSITSTCKVQFASTAGLCAVQDNEQLWLHALRALL